MSLPILAQPTTTVADKPPAISFDDWHEVRADDFTRQYQTSFPSAYDSPYPTNNFVPVQAFIPVGVTRPVPVVVILHYWGATDLSLEASMGRELNLRGIAAVAIALPYHLSRTPRGTKSGELALEADPQKLIASMTQSVWDVRRTLDWIETRPEFDKGRIGLAGTSLGGIVGSLAFGIEKRLLYGAFVLAGLDLAGILWDSSKVVSQREALRQKGFTEQSLRAALSPIEPGTYLSPDGRPGLIIAAKLDTVVPPAYAEKLADHLSLPAMVWLDTGHFGGALVRGRIVRTVASFFDSCCTGASFRAPSTINAPTIRFGAILTPAKGLQAVLSTDIWRAGGDKLNFAAIQISPQGPQAFIGRRVARDFSIGVVAFPQRVSFGLSWSVPF